MAYPSACFVAAATRSRLFSATSSDLTSKSFWLRVRLLPGFGLAVGFVFRGRSRRERLRLGRCCRRRRGLSRGNRGLGRWSRLPLGDRLLRRHLRLRGSSPHHEKRDEAGGGS